MADHPKIGVVGNGSWGTALVKMLTENLDAVHWWVHSEPAKQFIEENHHNPNYLPSVRFNPGQLIMTTDINDIVNQVDYLIFAVPSIYLVDCLDKLTTSLENKVVFTSIKGVIPEKLKLVGDYFIEEFNLDSNQLGIISGPCHAEEVASERLSYLTIAANDILKAKTLSLALNSRFIKTTLSDDVIGIEYTSVLKNVYSIAGGIAHGLRYGDNFHSIMMSNSIREMENFLDKIAPDANRDINQSVYLGDLLVTGYSSFSRNRLFGAMIGKGYTVRSAMLEMSMVAEGYYAAKGIHDIFEDHEDLEMPILKTTYRILYKDKDPWQQINKLTEKLN